jgi:anthranilate phosphoribosyltransferase
LKVSDEIMAAMRSLSRGEDLSADLVRSALNAIGETDRIVNHEEPDGMLFLGLAIGLMAKTPTSDELLGLTQSIGDQTRRVEQPAVASLVDLSGTGGDQIKTFNVGSAASVVTAACGLPVAKQATRGYTGPTGSADVFRNLGIDPYRVSPSQAASQINRIGLSVFYPPGWSEGLRTRIEFLDKLATLGLRLLTPWHLVAWLHSPFDLTARLYGVFSPEYVELLAPIFLQYGPARVLVVHGIDGLDEISPIGRTIVAEINAGELRRYEVTPEDFGLPTAEIDEISTYTAAEREQADSPALRSEGARRNMDHFLSVLAGRERGARRDMVAMNAGAALYVGGVATSLQEGAALADGAIESGEALRRLRDLAASTGDGDRLVRELAG